MELNTNRGSKMKPLISEETRQEIVRLYVQEGLSVEGIRQKLGGSRVRIIFTLEGDGFYPRKEGRVD